MGINHHNRNRSRRRIPKRVLGVTVLEVLFAIFVVIVGLLGIASIIPLASRHALQSRNQTNAQALGRRWFNEFFTRRLNEHDVYSSELVGYNWQWYKDYTFGGSPPNFYNFQKDYSATYPTAPNPIGILPGTNQSFTYSSGSSFGTARIWGHQAVCIDPTFYTEPDVVQRVNNDIANGVTLPLRLRGYRGAVFPYYEDGLNPTADPFDDVSSSNPWPDQPRMVRVTLGFDTIGVVSSGTVSRKLVDEIFASADDLSITADDTDKTKPAGRRFAVNPLTVSDPTDDVFLKGQVTSEYSWLATMAPAEPFNFDLAADPDAVALQVTNDYLLTLVILHRRDRQFLDPSLTPQSTFSPKDHAEGERLVWVQPLSGAFTGGNGGRVRLIANNNVESDVHIGDWIMLSRHEFVSGSDSTERYAKFRWYRIIAVDQDARVNTLSNASTTGTDPYGNSGGNIVWSRDVVLEGPDWNFAPVGGAGGPHASPTSGTLMKNVINVIERSVSVQ